MTNQKLRTLPAGTLVVCWAILCLGSNAVAQPTGAQRAGIFDDHAEPQAAADGQEIKVGSFGQVDLHVKDLEIAQVLQLLSLQSERNIIASRNVAGSISADLYGVDFYEALDAILHTNGFGYQEKGNLIFVYTTSELEAIKAAERKTIHRIVRLNYITAADASAFVTPLLSEAGALSVSGDVAAGFQPSIGDGGANSFAHGDTLIIHDYAENVDEIVAVLEELDQRPKQVLVEATILQAGLIEQNAFGVDLSVLADFALSSFLDPLGVVDDVISGVTPISQPGAQGRAAVSTSVGNTQAGLAGVKVGIVTHSVSAFIRALDDVTDTTVIANPKVLVLNRQKSDLLVGRKLGYLSSTATDTSTTQTVEFLEIGTQLTLRPFISDDGFIRMELRPSVSDGNTNRTVGTFVIPETRNQEMTTNVVVRNGQTVVMGGLFKEDTTVTRKQVPGLGDIPILGNLFKGHDDDVTRDEVIFLITPTIVKDEALYEMGERVAGSVEIARLGAREGLLPWSHSKMIAAHLRDAQKFYEEGNSQKALWSADLALTMDPKSIEAARLKEKLTGQSTLKPVNFSILQEAVDKMIHSEIDSGRRSLREWAPVDHGSPQPGSWADPEVSDLSVQTTQPAPVEAEQRFDSDPDPLTGAEADTAVFEPDEAVATDAVDDAEAAEQFNDDGVQDTDNEDVWSWAKNILEPDKLDEEAAQAEPVEEPTVETFQEETFQEEIFQEPQPVVVTPAGDESPAAPDAQNAVPDDSGFGDGGEMDDWIEADPGAEEMWRQMIETEPVENTQPEPEVELENAFPEDVEPQAQEQGDGEAVRPEVFDEQPMVADELEGVVELAVPVIDQPELFTEELDLDLPALDWQEEPAAQVVEDEAAATIVADQPLESFEAADEFEAGLGEADVVVDLIDDGVVDQVVDFDESDLDFESFNEGVVDADPAFDQPDAAFEALDGGVGEPARLRFTEDEVGSTDSFDAVVEWLLTPEEETAGGAE